MVNLSQKSLELLNSIFNSNLQLPVTTAEEIVEIRAWLKQELSNGER